MSAVSLIVPLAAPALIIAALVLIDRSKPTPSGYVKNSVMCVAIALIVCGFALPFLAPPVSELDR